MSRSDNTNYRKRAPNKDFRKFVIVVDGEQENKYFRFFQTLNPRIIIKPGVTAEEESAVTQLMEEMSTFNYKQGLEPEDLVWFVLDVDRWPRVLIDQLSNCCDMEDNWHIAISNQCFEIWLLYHIIPEIPKAYNTTQKLKYGLDELISKGYKQEDILKQVRVAAERAAKKDEYKDNYFPLAGVTKVYILAEELLKFLGNDWSDSTEIY
jgi:hypothetical protein